MAEAHTAHMLRGPRLAAPPVHVRRTARSAKSRSERAHRNLGACRGLRWHVHPTHSQSPPTDWALTSSPPA
eukprot:7380820-Prymnesium_polylepis.2